MTSLVAAGLMISVGAGMLAWYYTEALSRPARAPAHASPPEAAGGGMTLPAFGTAALPREPLSTASVPVASSAQAGAAPQPLTVGPSSPMATPPPDSLLEPSLNQAAGGSARGHGAPPPPSPRQHALDRRLSGEVFSEARSSLSSSVATGDLGAGQRAALPPGRAPAAGQTTDSRGDALETLLRPGILRATRAQLLPTQRLLLPKGAFIDCTLETAVDSTLPGMTTCITATDTFGADGTVVLLERGTKLIGQTRGEVRQGEARVFVVWTEARTPSGVVVQLDSPGTDALGRSGLEGKVNRHFWQRFGAAALVSTIDGLVQSRVQSSSRNGTVVLDPTASEDVLTGILRSTVDISPTIRVRNGTRIQVLVARDVDFGPVYELEPR
ncbi:MAG TPA: type IV secretion system protein VirB10 [Steroidobacteraceae bacterium]|nr:type IV secretion system protein VirB10 [Steroidobacteraceae bacterium]